RLAKIEQEFGRFRSMQPRLERQTAGSPATAAPVTEREIEEPAGRPSPQPEPASAALRGAPAPAKWTWQPPADQGPTTSQLRAAEPAPEPTAPALPAPASAVSRLGARLESAGAGGEWELLIGGRWLNKIGVAVLVVGMALLLNFALDYLGPAGKVAL